MSAATAQVSAVESLATRWQDERYVRFYTRDTVAWACMRWEAKCVIGLVMRKLSRAGMLELGQDGIAGLAKLIDVPFEVVEPGMAELLKRGTFALNAHTGRLVMPNYVRAQEASASDRLRKQEQREREAAAKQVATTAENFDEEEKTGIYVTAGHVSSHAVTLCSAVPSVHSKIPPTPQGGSTVGEAEPVRPSGVMLVGDRLQVPPPPPSNDDVTTAEAPPVAPGAAPRTIRANYVAFEGPQWIASYENAVRATLGTAWATDNRQIHVLKRAIEAHCPRGVSPGSWIEKLVPLFVRAAESNGVSHFYCHLRPDGFLTWLNDGQIIKKGVTGRPGIVSAVQPAPATGSIWREGEDDGARNQYVPRKRATR